MQNNTRHFTERHLYLKPAIDLRLIGLLWAFILGFASCGDSTEESNVDEKPVAKQTLKLEDENDFYKVYTSEEDCDSVAFSTVWLMDKQDSSLIKVTDSAAMIANGEIEIEGKWEEWYVEGMVSLNEESRSIISHFRVNLLNNVRHPWKLSLYCFGFGHEYSSLIVSEDEREYEELYNSDFVCKSKCEDVVFFDKVEDYTDWDYGRVSYIVYDKDMKKLREELTLMGLDDSSKTDAKIIKKGKPVAINNIGKPIHSHSVSVYNDETGFAEDRTIAATRAENGDIVSYLVDKERNKAIKLPVNDEFVCENNIGFVFLSYKTYKNGKRYSVLRLVDSDGNLRYEISGNLQ